MDWLLAKRKADFRGKRDKTSNHRKQQQKASAESASKEIKMTSPKLLTNMLAEEMIAILQTPAPL